MNIIHFTSQQELWDKAVAFLKELSDEREGKLVVGVSGGSSSKIFDQLKASQVDISPWELYVIDERYVAPDHEHSNYKLINNKFSEQRAVSSEQSKVPVLHDFDTTLPIEASLQDYFHRLPYRFDVVIYGMGSDGHTASLFPASAEASADTPPWLDTHDLVAHTQTEAFDVKDRLTLTYPALEKADHHLILAMGESKKPVIEALENYFQVNPDSREPGFYKKYPIAKILEWEGSQLLFCS